MDKWNTLQKFPVQFDFSLTDTVFNLYFPSLEEEFLVLDKYIKHYGSKLKLNKPSEDGGASKNYSLFNKILKSRLSVFLKKLGDLVFLLIFQEIFFLKGKDIVTLYYYWYFDVSFRMYPKGPMNYYNNKLIRSLIAFGDSSNDILECSDQSLRYSISAKLENSIRPRLICDALPITELKSKGSQNPTVGFEISKYENNKLSLV